MAYEKASYQSDFRLAANQLDEAVQKMVSCLKDLGLDYEETMAVISVHTMRAKRMARHIV